MAARRRRIGGQRASERMRKVSPLLTGLISTRRLRVVP